MDKITEALKLAEEALNAMLTHMGMDEDEWTKPTFDQSRKTLAAIREALAEQSMVMILNDPHPPHRLCECTACLEYWTPLPDCDAFAASGKPIAETVKTYEQGYLDGYDAGLIFANSRVEPVKQEPVAIVKYFDIVPLQASMCLEPDTLLYAAPVSAEAIRAEALEEAAKWFEGKVGQADLRDITAAIRGLK